MEWTLDEANRRLAAEGYPPIKRLPADEAALAAWRRAVDASRELEETGKMSERTLLAVSQFCHCLKCPSYPRGEMPVFCLRGKSDYEITPVTCKCPSCEVYHVGTMFGTDYFCSEGVPVTKFLNLGGAKGVAKRFLKHEIEKGNPGKRLPERLMSVPGFVERGQDEIETPAKVPGA
jgi:hypothetical protein